MNAIEILEKTKLNICTALAEELEPKNYEDQFDADPFADNSVPDMLYRECRIVIKKLATDKKAVIPNFIKNNRTIDELVNELTSEMESRETLSTLSTYVRTHINEFIDYLEDEQLDVKIIHVKSEIPEHLTYAHILEDLAKCDKRFDDGDYSGAITSARSLVEGVCNEIVNKITGEDLEDKLDLPALFTLVRKKLNLNTDNPKLEKPLKQVISGLTSVVNGLAEIRNENGDVHHRRYEVNKHHALVVINSAKTVITFLFNTYEYQLEKGTLVKA